MLPPVRQPRRGRWHAARPRLRKSLQKQNCKAVEFAVSCSTARHDVMVFFLGGNISFYTHTAQNLEDCSGGCAAELEMLRDGTVARCLEQPPLAPQSCSLAASFVPAPVPAMGTAAVPCHPAGPQASTHGC